jgi:hypothetical protein
MLLGRPLHVDGISYYQLDSESGLIVEHKIDHQQYAYPAALWNLLVAATGCLSNATRWSRSYDYESMIADNMR